MLSSILYFFGPIYHSIQIDTTTKKKNTKKDFLLCLQYLLPLQVVPEVPPHPANNQERLRIAAPKKPDFKSKKTCFCVFSQEDQEFLQVPGFPCSRLAPVEVGKKESVCHHSGRMQSHASLPFIEIKG